MEASVIAPRKIIGLAMLVLTNIAIVANLQPVAACASMGYAVIPYYFIALITFFIPCIVITAHLVTAYPKIGAPFHWMQLAFGKRVGFIGVSLIWLANVLWYPVAFSFVAAGIAYLFNPHWAHSNIYMVSTTLAIYWLVTLLNILGVRVSAVMSSLLGLIGIVFPVLLVIALAVLWWLWDLPRQIHFSWSVFMPHFIRNENIGFLIAVLTTLSGIEMTSAHAGNVIEPQKNFPKALFISGLFVFSLLLGAALAIALIVPRYQIGLASGILDAFTMFFSQTPFVAVVGAIIFLVLVGNIGSVMAWMLSSTRGMQVASCELGLHPWLQLTNRYEAPVGILGLEAIIFTMMCSVYFIFQNVNQSYWFLLDLASQISLIYYCLLFLSAFWLYRHSRNVIGSWVVPGGYFSMALCVLLGVLSAGTAVTIGFMPPSHLQFSHPYLFQILLIVGILLSIMLPFVILILKKVKVKKHKTKIDKLA